MDEINGNSKGGELDINKGIVALFEQGVQVNACYNNQETISTCEI